ncbi:MAG TPA: hypothetical protein VF290_11835 [Pyrinomonadaceae bacterium]
MKKDEIKKGNIIIGIAAFTIIAIVIIAAISFFSPKSHAQVLDKNFDQLVVSKLNKANPKALKDGKQWFNKNQKDGKVVFKAVSLANKFNAYDDQEQFDDGLAMFKDNHKEAFTSAFSGVKGAEKFCSAASFVKFEKKNFKTASYFEKEQHA